MDQKTDNLTARGSQRGNRLFLTVLCVLMGVLVCVVGFVIWKSLKGGEPGQTKRQEPVAADTVTYTVKVRFDEYHFKEDDGSYVTDDVSVRSKEELKEAAECEVTVKTDTAPYAWTGVFGDLSFPLVRWYGEPDEEEVTISSFPGVKIKYQFGEGLRVVEAGETVYRLENIWKFYFLDLNGDKFPELLAEGDKDDIDGGCNPFFVYDFYNHTDYKYLSPQNEGGWGEREFNAVRINCKKNVVTEWGTEYDVRWKDCDFAIRDGNLVLIERFPENSERQPKPELTDDSREAFCWFDRDAGDEGKNRTIRLPEYPGCYFSTDKEGLRLCYDDGHTEDVAYQYSAVVSVYFADFDKDGKRELFVSTTSDHVNRKLKRYVWTDDANERFAVDDIYSDGQSGLLFREDVWYRSSARFILENGQIAVQMMDPKRKEVTGIRLEFADFDEIRGNQPTDGEEGAGLQSTAPAVGDVVLVRRSAAGESFATDLQTLVILEEWPNEMIDPRWSAVYLPQNSIYSYWDYVTDDYGGIYRTIFADLDGDGIREICVNDSYVVETKSFSVIAKLDDAHMFVWHDDDIFVAEKQAPEASVYVPVADRIVGRPVLRNGKFEVVPVE